MRRQGFTEHFIELVYSCISTTSLAVVINSEASIFFIRKEVLGRDVPFLPIYLCLLLMNFQ